MRLFGSTMEYILSPFRSEMFTPSVYRTFDTPRFCRRIMASSPDAPVRWYASSLLAFTAPTPDRSRSALRSVTVPSPPPLTLRNPCGSTSRNAESFFTIASVSPEISPHSGLTTVQSASPEGS